MPKNFILQCLTVLALFGKTYFICLYFYQLVYINNFEFTFFSALNFIPVDSLTCVTCTSCSDPYNSTIDASVNCSSDVVI